MKKIALSAFVFSFLVLVASVSAAGVNVRLDPQQVSINISDTSYVDIVIANTQAAADTFSVSVWPSTPWEGVTPNLETGRVTIGANASAIVKLYLSVSTSAMETSPTFLVTAKSLSNSSVVHSASLTVFLTRKFSTYISDVVMSSYELYPLECANITVFVSNSGSAPAPLLTVETSVEHANVIELFSNQTSAEALSMKSVTNTHCSKAYASPGTYSVEARLKDNVNRLVSTKTVEFTIRNYSNVVQEEAIVYGLFTQTKVITVRNEGNVVEKNLYVTEAMPTFIKNFFVPKAEPDSEKELDSRIVYSWRIGDLQPGEKATVSYELNFISMWLAGIAVIVLVYFAFRYIYTPKIIKRHKHFGAIDKGKEIFISLEVRNPTINEINNVTVEDVVPPIAKVVERFDTVKPKIKRDDIGTVLEWNLKSLKPREERIFTYRIVPVVEIIGTLRLPGSTMSYMDRKKRRKTLVSKTVFVKPK